MHSFDVFDTLITRTTATPDGIFALMQKELIENDEYRDISPYLRQNFYQIRKAGEQMARKSFCINGIEDITLQELYQAIGATGVISREHLERLMDLECKMEYDNSVGIRENINRLKSLIQSGETVILISDMYLPSQTIREMLLSADPIFASIPLYVSSECKKSKHTGNLYPYVKQKETINKTWAHYGDNPHSDVKNALKHGIRAEHLPFEMLLPCEAACLKDRSQDPQLQLKIGAARNARLQHRLSGSGAMGASIGAGILYPYVFWLLRECGQKGISRLYFIARDGYVLKEIADLIIKEYHYPVKTHYIYGSRWAWRMAAASGDEQKVTGLLESTYLGRVRTLDDLAGFLGLLPGSLPPYLPAGNTCQNKYLTPDKVKLLWSFLKDNPDFTEFFRSISSEKKLQAAAYLAQEIDVRDGNFAFVEVYGSGITQMCLAALMGSFYSAPIKTFYYAMETLRSCQSCINYIYLPGDIFRVHIIEALCRAPHGQTIGYREEHGSMRPVLRPFTPAGWYGTEYPQYLNGIRRFTSIFSAAAKKAGLQADQPESALLYLDYCANRPDPKVLSFIGDLPFDQTATEQTEECFAPILSPGSIRSLFFLHPDKPMKQYYNGADLDYSILRSGKRAEQYVRYYKKLSGCSAAKPALRLYNNFQAALGRQPRQMAVQDLLAQDIIIYGAGKAGRAVYRRMKRSRRHNIVLWVDKNDLARRQSKLPVSPVAHILTVSYGQILIAVIHEAVAREIWGELLHMGIPAHKILWVIPDLRKKHREPCIGKLYPQEIPSTLNI